MKVDDFDDDCEMMMMMRVMMMAMATNPHKARALSFVERRRERKVAAGQRPQTALNHRPAPVAS